MLNKTIMFVEIEGILLGLALAFCLFFSTENVCAQDVEKDSDPAQSVHERVRETLRRITKKNIEKEDARREETRKDQGTGGGVLVEQKPLGTLGTKDASGIWNVNGVVKVKIGKDKDVSNVYDVFFLASDHRFLTSETDYGTWKQRKKRVTMCYDNSEVEVIMNDYFDQYSYELVYVTKVKYFKFIAIEKGNRLEKGKIKGKLYIDSPEFKRPKTVMISGNFTGTKTNGIKSIERVELIEGLEKPVTEIILKIN